VGWLQDVRYAVRLIRKSPGFSAFVVTLLALGIGLNSAIFSLLDALLLRPLPVRQPGELVRLVQVTPQLGARSNFTYHSYKALRERAASFLDVIGFTEGSAGVRDAGGAHQVRVQLVTGTFFRSLGVPPLLGRALDPADELRAAGSLPAVLSYAYWMRRYGGDPSAVGRPLTLQNRAFTIVGVMPRGFHGVQVETGPDLRVPLIAGEGLFSDPDFNSYRKFNYTLVARLRPGIRLDSARAEAESVIYAALDDEFRGTGDALYWHTGQFQLQRMTNGLSLLRPKFSPALWLLMGGGVMLLLIVCANAGGLLLARTAARSGEIAVRLALGAPAGRLVRQWLTESILLTTMGGFAGSCVAWMASPLLVRFLPPLRDLDATAVTFSLDLRPDLRLLAFSSLCCLAAALLAGLPAALATARPDLHATLKAVRATRRQRFRWALVTLQIGLCAFLVAVSGLLVSTFQRLHSVEPGFDRDHIVTFALDPGMAGYAAPQQRDLESRLLASVRALPGVESAALAARALMRGTGWKTTFAPAGQTAPAGEFMNTSLNRVSPEYFDTMGMRVLAGRNFRPGEPAAKPTPAVVNQAFVRHFFPTGDPIGRSFGQGHKRVAEASNEIIGVVSDARYRSLREAIQPTVYTPWRDTDTGDFILQVRTHSDPASIIGPVQGALRAIDPRLPFYEIRTMAEEVDASLWAERVLAWLSAGFSFAAALLSALGVYGTLAYAITQGRREIGIRMALGAPPAGVIRLFSARPMLCALTGAICGTSAFYASAPFFRDLLYETLPRDPSAICGAVVAVLLVALIATLTAVAGALRIQPATVLREE